MPDFNLTITLTDNQVTKVQWLFNVMNEQRVEQGLQPYANTQEMAEAALKQQLLGWYEMADAQFVKEWTQLFKASDDATRQAAMDALLGNS